MIKREWYLKKIRPFYDNELIKVIVGIRRCGKSVIMRQIVSEIEENGTDAEHIIFINFEDLAFSRIKNEMDLYRYIMERIKDKKKYYLFFDEIQNVDHFEKAVNSFRATDNVSIFMTGSNSRLLSGELSTLLSGRYVSFHIMPFSFREVCILKKITKDKIDEKVLNDYLKWGGMPQRFCMNTEEETKTFLIDIYNSIVLKDIVQRSRVKDVDMLNRIIEYLVSTPSQLFSAKSISNFIESENRTLSRETLYNYLGYITSSFIMHKAGRYDLKGKKKLATLEKYYLTDMGLGRVKDTESHVNLGAALENVVYNELLIRGYEVYIGKIDNGEVDFVATRMNEKIYFQVAYLLADDRIIEREFGVFASVEDNFPKYVISMDKWDFSRDGIIHKNAIDFLLEE
ncbi:MAG: ATP-binding protein [Lachnospiraceae bacterium]|nr:ATP-binding protein [Lachnospiraceae bacterium]